MRTFDQFAKQALLITCITIPSLVIMMRVIGLVPISILPQDLYEFLWDSMFTLFIASLVIMYVVVLIEVGIYYSNAKKK